VRRSLLGIALVVALGITLLMPRGVAAHALAQSSVPAAGAIVDSAPPAVTVTFGETPDPKLSKLTVVDTAANSVTAGPTSAVAGNPLQLTVPLKPIAHGVFTVTWLTVSDVDGHLASGSFAFGFGVPPTGTAVPPSSVESPAPSPLDIAARGVLYAGLILVLGLAVIAMAVFREPPRGTGTLLAAGAAAVLVGTLGVIDAQRAAAQVAWGDIFSSSLGRNLVERALPAVLLLAVTVAWRALRARRWSSLLALGGAAALAAMAVDVLTSHAGAQSPVPLNEAMQLVHIAAAGVWVGGLTALLVGLRGVTGDERGGAIRRYSATAAICLALVAATGVVRAAVELQSWPALVTTAFGVLVLIKVALLLAVAGLGAVNRYRNVPRGAGGLRGLRRIGTAELLGVTTAVFVAAALVNVAPPVASGTAASAGPQPLVVSASDFATTVKLRLEISPGSAGFNSFHATVTGYDSGAPVDATAVRLTFTLPDLPAIAASTLELKRTAAGVYDASGGNLAIDGTWKVTALVERGAASVEVEMSLTTRSAPPQVDVLNPPGLPPLYSIHLSRNRIVQVYLDPDKIGQNKFHATFFDAAQNEMPVSGIVIDATPPGGTRAALDPQRLSAGHFAATLALRRGATRFTIIATVPGGEHLATAIDLTPPG
jgi:copper transport protein